MKLGRVLAVICLVIIMVSSASAFNGLRKGFVLGGGLGLGPVANTSIDGLSGEYKKAGLATNFLIGYAWDEQNMIVFLRDAVLYSETIELAWMGSILFRDKISIVQGFTGAGYYHYFGPVGRSFYITGGLGVQDWTSLEEDWNSPDVGGALLFGGGYEFARHWQVHGSLSLGSTSDAIFEYNHVQLLFTISAVAF